MKREFSLTVDGTAYKVAVDGDKVLVNGRPFSAVPESGTDRVAVDGTPFEVKIDRPAGRVSVGGISYDLAVQGLEAEGEAERGRRAGGPAPAVEGAVTAIMPGKIIRVLVAVGDTVAEGQVACILEAMKMENELKAPRAGVVKALHVQPGRDVERGAVLVEIG